MPSFLRDLRSAPQVAGATASRADAPLLAAAALAAAAASGVALLARSHGGYQATAWIPAGIVVVLSAGGLLAFGLRPSRPVVVASLAFVALGGWSVFSVAWGGLPNESWRVLGQLIVAASALVLGSLVGVSRWAATAMRAGVLAGITINAAELLLGPVVGWFPPEWIEGRRLLGSVGYQNAQAGLMALGLPLGVWGIGSRRAVARAASAAAATLLVGAILVTQSRAGLGAAALGIVVALVWTRSTEVLIRTVPLVIAGALLVAPLREVDAALVKEARAEEALAAFAWWTLLASVVVGLFAVLPMPPRRLRRGIAAVAVAAALATAVVGAFELRASGVLSDAFSDVNPSLASPGSTRLASLSLNGRRDAWRVAWDTGRASPLVGAGQGTFALAWTEERRLEGLFILQPHSIAFELFAELGLVGLVLFGLACAVLLVSIARGRDRRVAAAALGAVIALLGQAAIDWTWSFPGLVLPAFVLAGACCCGLRRAPPRRVSTVAGALALAAVVVVLGSQLMGTRLTEDGRELVERDPTRAVSLLEDARRWNPWDPEPLRLLGLVAERGGEPALAADRYAQSAELSQAQWLDRYREARAARTAGEHRRAAEACELAAQGNPAETRLREAIC